MLRFGSHYRPPGHTDYKVTTDYDRCIGLFVNTLIHDESRKLIEAAGHSSLFHRDHVTALSTHHQRCGQRLQV
jgi:hypothetical protein